MILMEETFHTNCEKLILPLFLFLLFFLFSAKKAGSYSLQIFDLVSFCFSCYLIFYLIKLSLCWWLRLIFQWSQSGTAQTNDDSRDSLELFRLCRNPLTKKIFLEGNSFLTLFPIIFRFLSWNFFLPGQAETD